MQIRSTRVLYVIWDTSNYVTADAISSLVQHKMPHLQLRAAISHTSYRPVRLCFNIITEQAAMLAQTNYYNIKIRGGVRSTRGLGPTMTARGQSIGISSGMLPQTLIMSITAQKTLKYYTTQFDLEEGF